MHAENKLSNSRNYRVLVVEDNPTDARLVSEALSQFGVDHDLLVLRDGEKAIAYLRNLDSTAIPDLIILDINMPRRDGLEVLVQYRMNVLLCHVPMVVLTSSDAPGDKFRADIIGVSAFIRKPLLLDEYLALGEKLKTILETPFTYTGLVSDGR